MQLESAHDNFAAGRHSRQTLVLGLALETLPVALVASFAVQSEAVTAVHQQIPVVPALDEPQRA
jgi:hypothetical protein